MYDPEYDAIVTQLRGTFYPRPFTDTANPDLAGYAIGATPIGPNWLKARRTFNSAAAAEDFLRALIPEQAHPRSRPTRSGSPRSPPISSPAPAGACRSIRGPSPVRAW